MVLACLWRPTNCPELLTAGEAGEDRDDLMTIAKIYPLNVEADVEALSTSLAELREKARKTLIEAQTEFDQIPVSPALHGRKSNRKAARKSLELWGAIEERIEDAFEDLDKAIREIRKPFRN
jgi:hypothetical protein